MEKWELRQAMLFGARSGDLKTERILTYFLFADQWGWTQRDVDECDADTVFALRHLLIEVLKEKERLSRKDRKQFGF